MSAALILFITRSLCDTNLELRQNILEIRMNHDPNEDTIIFSHQPYMRNACTSTWLYEDIANGNPTTIWTLDKHVSINKFHYIKKPSLSILYFDDIYNINGTVQNLRKNRLWNTYGKTLVLVYKEELAKLWISTLWDATLASNIVVLVMDPIKYFTWYPYGSKDCSMVNTIIETSITKLYHYTIQTNQHNCTIKAITRKIYPYVIQGNNDLDGVELTLFRTILEKSKLRFKFIENRDFFWNSVRDDGSIGGSLLDVYENYADIAFAGLPRRYEYMECAEMLISHTEDSLTWFVPAPKYIPNIEKIERALNPDTWIYIFIVYILVTCVVITITLVIQSENYSILGSIMNTMRVYLCTTISMPKHHLLRFLYFVLYVYSIHTTILYQSALIYILSNLVSEAPIKTIQEAVDKNLEFHFYEVSNFLVNDSNWSLWSEITRKGLVHMHSHKPPFYDIQYKGVFLGPRKLQAHYLRQGGAVDDEGRLTFFPLDDSLMVNGIVFIMTPGHPLAPMFNRIIFQLLEGGFSHWWFENMEEPDWEFNNRENEPLTVESLSGAFLLILIFCCIALVVFFFELMIPIVHRLMRPRRIRWAIRTVHHL